MQRALVSLRVGATCGAARSRRNCARGAWRRVHILGRSFSGGRFGGARTESVRRCVHHRPRHHQPLASTGRARCGCACNALARCHRCCHWLGGFVRRALRDAPNMLTTLNVPRVSACSRRAAQLEDIVGADRRSSAVVLLLGANNAHGVACRASHAMTRRCNAPAPTPCYAYGSSTARGRLAWLLSSSTVLQ